MALKDKLVTLEDLKEIADRKADNDGYYQDMTVGDAEQLVATAGVEETDPYSFRKTGGGVTVGNRATEKMIGGTVAWNQLVHGEFGSDYGTYWNVYSGTGSVSNGELTVTNAVGRDGAKLKDSYIIDIKDNHVYFASVDYKSNVNLQMYLLNNPTLGISENWTNHSIIYKHSAGATKYRNLDTFPITSGRTGTFSLRNAMAFDLTQMFGTEIADYIYGLEQANPGDGVAWFRKYFPNDYYAYDAGSLQSVNAEAHKTNGFNQWDEEWEAGRFDTTTGANVTDQTQIRSKNYIPIIGGNTYSVTSNPGIWCLFFDANKNAVPSGAGAGYNTSGNSVQLGYNYPAFPTPSNARYMRFYCQQSYGTTYKNDICINLSCERNGEYEPYDGHDYPLGDVELRGIPKLVDGQLAYDGDEYLSSGLVNRRFYKTTLNGSENSWAKSSTFSGSFFLQTSGDTTIKSYSLCICDKLVAARSMSSYAEGFICLESTAINVWFPGMSDKTLQEFKTYLSTNPITIVYELATPTTEQSDTYVNPQAVDYYGTEAYIDRGVSESERDVSIPVGHDTFYQQNLRAKIQNAPDNPVEDGKYVVQHTNGANKYIPLAGEYNDLTAGSANQLVSTVGIEDKVPYSFRTAGGSADIGDRVAETVVGGTIAWNQLFPFDSDTFTANGVTWTINNGHVVSSGTFSLTASFSIFPSRIYNQMKLKKDHRYLLYFSGSYSGNIAYSMYYSGHSQRAVFLTDRASKIFTPAYDDMTDSEYIISGEVGSDATGDFYTYLVDLTQMFGSTIADYVYGLETATAGAGVAWFRHLFPNPYYAYNPGELMSVKAAQHDMVGFNAVSSINLNPVSTAYSSVLGVEAELLPNTTYCISFVGVSGNVIYTNENLFATQNNITCDGTRQMVVVTTKSEIGKHISSQYENNFGWKIFKNKNTNTVVAGFTDVCINLSWDGERDGEYEPYVKHSYPLGDVELRGIPKLDANNSLYYDGDVYSPDGTVTRKYDVVDLGTLTWTWSQVSNRFETILSNVSLNNVACICSRYETYNVSLGWANKDKVCSLFGSRNNLFIKDTSYSDVATFKTAMSGVYLVYELATPTTETSDPYTSPQIVDDFGTEEYVDRAVVAGDRDVSVPVGHDSFYQANLRAKLEMAPDSPDGDGDYIVRQSNGENAYVPLVIPTELPAAPTTDGTYTLKVTVSDGTATYAWTT